MIDEDQSVAAIARSLNRSEKLLHRWKYDHKKQLGQLKATSVDELQQLKNQLKRVEMERDILKKYSSSLASRRNDHV